MVKQLASGAVFNLWGRIKEEGRWYIAHCPPLDITTQGRTLSEAKKNLIEASELFIMSCLERGTFDQALKELGFVAGGVQRVPVDAFRISFPVPFRFEKSHQCRV